MTKKEYKRWVEKKACQVCKNSNKKATEEPCFTCFFNEHIGRGDATKFEQDTFENINSMEEKQMCMICHEEPCVCKAFAVCSVCGCEIFEGERYYEHGDETVCDECLEERMKMAGEE